MYSRSRTSSDISVENIDISKPIIIKIKKMKRRQRDQDCQSILSKSPNPNDYELKYGMIIRQIKQ